MSARGAVGSQEGLRDQIQTKSGAVLKRHTGHRRTGGGDHRFTSEEGESRRAGGLPEQVVLQMCSDLEAMQTYLSRSKVTVKVWSHIKRHLSSNYLLHVCVCVHKTYIQFLKFMHKPLTGASL